ncbi:FtsK/SpoIIIE domain-containing protein [Streptomyces cavernicola]|uniref:FtsK/SpoIIIE domain-containing protein n=1 Tax=Streptomyces cavernicola TaxID=3043613 RepID=A0ABT6SCQ8_9ACTN|nr:FtsK/SpoIIIE domain-containing protein [Streptomyces sp. B-S-A6]MDI3405750.1 FtsK/SpoIIIE domain-containing protein [Streptomyces sp. B-S-A6]
MLTVVEGGGDAFDVHLDADPDTPVGAVALALAEAGGVPLPPDGAGLYAEGRLLPSDLLLRDAPLHHAAVVGLGRPAGERSAEPAGLVEVRAVGGPGAGAVHRLDIGEYRVGLAQDGTPRVQRQAPYQAYATLQVGPRGRCTVAPDAPGGTQPSVKPPQLDREDVTEEVAWAVGAQLLVGGALLELSLPQSPDAALEPSEDGTGRDYNRPPRLRPAETSTRFTLPTPPTPPAHRSLPWIAATVPLVMAVAGWLIFQRPSMLLFGLLSPVAVLGNYLMNKRGGRQSHAEAVAAYEEKKARIEGDARAALEAERTARRRGFPDPAEVILTAVGPRRRLWERRTSDADFLELRVGTADQPSDVVLRDPTKDEHRRQDPWTALDVPVTVPLREHDVLGIAGAGEAAQAVARWAVAQAAVLHSPRDLQIHLLTAGGSEQRWAWLRWLPHVRKKSGDILASIGSGTETSARRIAELTALIAERRAQHDKRNPVPGPDVLVVLDGARRLRSLPGIVQILRDGPAVGVRAICLDAEERLLPEECQAVVAEEPGGTLRVGRSGAGTATGIRPDLVSPDWCRSLARALGPLRDPGGADEEAAVLPGAARLLDVLALDPPQASDIRARWQAGGRSTRAAVGVSLDGPFYLDLRRDGPHGLVAGTTGSGKSELLQTLVASLAVANRPDAMTFVLVDYKGGSAFKDCVRLPHTVGMVTDLDAHLVERALVSLTAELTRREHILAEAGAKDIEDYVDLLEREPGAGRPPLPRLLIVIDEFASMVRDLPDFVKGLVNIAQRGRSLGIHLILATQRPSGVVSSEIRANTNLRIALRVTDSGESQDVINSPDAAGISQSTPGRAYVRLGQTSLVPFQAGRVGGRRPGASAAALPEPRAVVVGWDQLGEPLPPRPRRAVRATGEAETDLTYLVEAVRGADRALGIPAQHSPWLPPLPLRLVAEDLPPAPAADGYDLPPVAYGVVDLPAEQARRPLVIDPATLGHLHVVGSPRQGRSQTLRTIAGALARAHSPARLHLYGIDCGNGALLAVEGLPHCGAVAQRTQPDRVARLLARLTAELARRQELLAARGSADLPELRRALPEDERPPHIVVFLDRWEVFDKTLGEYDAGNLLNGMLALLRDGASAGIHLIMSGDRALFSSRVGNSTEDKLVLKLNDKSEYGLIGVTQRKVPDEIPPGRALRAADKAEVQIALLTADPGGQAQAAALQRIAADCRERYAGLPDRVRPFRVDVLPDRIGYDEALAYVREPRPRLALAGVGGDELTAHGPDFALTPTFLVAGPARSGRSTVLATLARSLLSAGTSVVVGAPARSPLRDLAGRPGVLAVFDEADIAPDALETALAAAPDGAVVLLDDADLLLKTKAEPVLTQIAKTGAETGRGLVVAGQTDRLSSGFSGWHAEARRNRCGLLLKPQNMSDGELIGVKVPRSRLGATRPGRAILHLGDGVLRTVQVPETVLPAVGN